MVLFALLMPVVILVVIGMIYSDPKAGSAPGMVNLTFGAFLSIGICAVDLMGLPLVLAEYRHRKVLKRLQVTPVHPGLLLSVQLIVQAAVAGISAMLVTLTGVLFFDVRIDSPFSLIAGFSLVLISLFAIGLVIASTAKDVKRAGMLCSIAYFPMLLFSGTTIPFPVFPDFLQKAAVVLPLRHGILLLNGLALGDPLDTYLLQVGILGVIALGGVLLSVKTFRWDME